MSNKNKLNAKNNVVRAAVDEVVFDHYLVTDFHYQRRVARGSGHLSVSITPCCETEGGELRMFRGAGTLITIEDPLQLAEDNPSGEVQTLLDAIDAFVASESDLIGG